MFLKIGKFEVFAEYPSITRGNIFIDYLHGSCGLEIWIGKLYIQLSKELTKDDTHKKASNDDGNDTKEVV